MAKKSKGKSGPGFAQKVLLALSALLLVAVFSYTWPQEDVQTVQEIVPQVRSRSGKGRKKRHKKADQESRSSPEEASPETPGSDGAIGAKEDNQESGPEATQPPTHEEPKPLHTVGEVKPTWIFCAGQWQECLCGGRVKWGNDDKWKMIELPKDKSIQKVICSIDVLGDLIPGDGGKHCQCEVTPGTDFYWRLNPMLMPRELADSTGSRLISSCEIFEEGQGTVPGGLQWRATEAFCSEAWESQAGRNPALKPGTKRVELSTLQDLMNVRIDARFLKTYERHMDDDGWIPRAFVNYYAGAPDGKHTLMSDELIRSVHLFSNELIVVFHLGSLTPDTWTPERYPRLLLMHLAPLGPKVQKSFNYNKLRAMLISRVRVGVQLDSDQFVAPGADYMFNMTEREITREYPIPILPVHYFSFTQRDAPSNIWWRRFCPDPPKCELHSMRWSHAHPTWTFWALPWIGKWLRRHFRDEELTMAGEKGALRIADIPEDEDMLNVAAWEDKVTKQWCKFDNDRTEFEELIKWDPSMGTKCPPGTGCSNIMADSRFYPKGAAKAHFTAHNAKDPKETARWIDRIHARYKKGLYPTKVIVYQGRLFSSGEELRKEFPTMPCIL
ncbi:Uncharacterized protein SCF082_LOCUS36458 [Durusdinium trenchii]|uniref:Uncharacterized protein n=1 Tax=Durusdinium trenchii TaxID=1381693 RepID=A0ABP0PGG7_9DINO